MKKWYYLSEALNTKKRLTGKGISCDLFCFLASNIMLADAVGKIPISSVGRSRRALSIFKDVPSRTMQKGAIAVQ